MLIPAAGRSSKTRRYNFVRCSTSLTFSAAVLTKKTPRPRGRLLMDTTNSTATATATDSGGGIEWPKDPTTGKVSTSSTNKEIWLSLLSSLTDAYGDVDTGDVAVADGNGDAAKDDGDDGPPPSPPPPPDHVIRAVVAVGVAVADGKGVAKDDEDDDGPPPPPPPPPPVPEYVIRAREIQSQLRSMPNSHWRHGYVPVLSAAAEIHACATPDEAVKMARAGLDALGGAMTCRGVSAREAVMGGGTGTDGGGGAGGGEGGGDGDGAAAHQHHFAGLVVRGRRPADDVTKKYRLAVPAGDSDAGGEREGCEYLTGDAARAQLEVWSSYGCMEPSAATSASAVVADESDATELVKDKVFVLLGATSELGPHDVLADLDATIVAVARRGSKLRSLIRKTVEGTGATLVVPAKRSGTAPGDDDAYSTANITMEKVDGADEEALDGVGADLIDDAPELARWISSLYPDKQLVISCLAYLDGEKNARAAVGMDLICEYVCKQRPNTALSFLVSPATAHVLPEEAALDSRRRLADAPWSIRMLSKTGVGFRPASITDPLPPNDLRVYNGQAVVQGPNYALAKTAQQWRAVVAEADGHVVSANMAPAARTQNMVSHSYISVALEGMQRFAPFVAFDPAPARTLMAALMLWDLNDKQTVEGGKSRHPLCLFEHNAVHGGMWRCPYDLGSMGAFSYAAGVFALDDGMWFRQRPGLIH